MPFALAMRLVESIIRLVFIAIWKMIYFGCMGVAFAGNMYAVRVSILALQNPPMTEKVPYLSGTMFWSDKASIYFAVIIAGTLCNLLILLTAFGTKSQTTRLLSSKALSGKKWPVRIAMGLLSLGMIQVVFVPIITVGLPELWRLCMAFGGILGTIFTFHLSDLHWQLETGGEKSKQSFFILLGCFCLFILLWNIRHLVGW